MLIRRILRLKTINSTFLADKTFLEKINVSEDGDIIHHKNSHCSKKPKLKTKKKEKKTEKSLQKKIQIDTKKVVEANIKSLKPLFDLHENQSQEDSEKSKLFLILRINLKYV